MRVITKNCRTCGDDFEPTGDLRDSVQTLHDCRNLHSECRRARRRGQRVLDVYIANQRQRHMRRAARRDEIPLAAMRLEMNVGGSQIGWGANAESQRSPGQLEPGPLRGVGIDDGGSFRLQVVEQQRLGPEVVLHRTVIIEMITSEVGEHHDVKRDAVDATLIQAVR